MCIDIQYPKEVLYNLATCTRCVFSCQVPSPGDEFATYVGQPMSLCTRTCGSL